MPLINSASTSCGSSLSTSKFMLGSGKFASRNWRQLLCLCVIVMWFVCYICRQLCYMSWEHQCTSHHVFHLPVFTTRSLLSLSPSRLLSALKPSLLLPLLEPCLTNLTNNFQNYLPLFHWVHRPFQLWQLCYLQQWQLVDVINTLFLAFHHHPLLVCLHLHLEVLIAFLAALHLHAFTLCRALNLGFPLPSFTSASTNSFTCVCTVLTLDFLWLPQPLQPGDSKPFSLTWNVVHLSDKAYLSSLI